MNNNNSNNNDKKKKRKSNYNRVPSTTGTRAMLLAPCLFGLGLLIKAASSVEWVLAPWHPFRRDVVAMDDQTYRILSGSDEFGSMIL